MVPSPPRVPLLTAPPPTYYETLDGRLPGHGERVSELHSRGILLHGSTEGGRQRLLQQIFTQPQLGPVFFEYIQRTADALDFLILTKRIGRVEAVLDQNKIERFSNAWLI